MNALRIILFIVVVLILLRIVGIDILDILKLPAVQEFFVFVKKIANQVWLDLVVIYHYFVNAK